MKLVANMFTHCVVYLTTDAMPSNARTGAPSAAVKRCGWRAVFGPSIRKSRSPG
jgi:hypothetical protein